MPILNNQYDPPEPPPYSKEENPALDRDDPIPGHNPLSQPHIGQDQLQLDCDKKFRNEEEKNQEVWQNFQNCVEVRPEKDDTRNNKKSEKVKSKNRDLAKMCVKLVEDNLELWEEYMKNLKGEDYLEVRKLQENYVGWRTRNLKTLYLTNVEERKIYSQRIKKENKVANLTIKEKIDRMYFWKRIGAVKGNVDEKMENEEIVYEMEAIIQKICEEKRKLKSKKKKVDLTKKCINILEDISDGWILTADNLNIPKSIKSKEDKTQSQLIVCREDKKSETIEKVSQAILKGNKIDTEEKNKTDTEIKNKTDTEVENRTETIEVSKIPLGKDANVKESGSSIIKIITKFETYTESIARSNFQQQQRQRVGETELTKRPRGKIQNFGRTF